MGKRTGIGIGLLLFGGTVWAQQYLISTVAGGGLPTTPNPATLAALETTSAIAADAAGNFYFAANNSVFKVDTSGILTVAVGSSTLPGYSGDGGQAPSAQLQQPTGLATDAAGNLYIADSGNSVIRKVAAATGIITTVAGNGTPGYAGDGGPATSAEFGHPRHLAADAAGNIYVADSDNKVIRKVAVATGTVTTVAGNGVSGNSGDGGPATSAHLNPDGVAVDGAGNFYISDTAGNVVRKVTAATGVITTVAGTGTAGFSGDTTAAAGAQLDGPLAVAADAAGTLYIADSGNFRIRKVAVATGIITTVAGGGTNASTTGPATSAQLTTVPGVAVDASGNIYIANGYVIRKVTAATGGIATVAGNGSPGFTGYTGDGGPATSAQLSSAPGVASDGAGNLYISDTANYVIRKVTAATGVITTVAGNGLPGYTGDGGPALSARITVSYPVAVDGSGNLYFAEGFKVRKVTAATGLISAVAGNGTNGNSGDGGPATSAQLASPTSVAVDGSGNLYIADTLSNVVRKVTAATGMISTVAGNGTSGNAGDGGLATAAQLQPTGLAVDGAGDLYVADLTHSVVRKVTAATGMITTVAGNGTPADSGDGGPATSAGLAPQGIAVDGAGNLYIADFYAQITPCGHLCNGTVYFNERVRKVTAATGVISTVAGNGTPGYSGDGGPAPSAQLNGPMSVAVDGSGNVFVADNFNNVVRMLVPAATHAILSIASTRSSNFSQGQVDATYSVVVSNAVGTAPTTGTVTVTEAAPAGLTLVSMSGAGWNCVDVTCSRGDVLNPGSSYPPITVTVNVASNAPAQVTNQVTVSGGGSATSSANDLTPILAGPPPACTYSIDPGGQAFVAAGGTGSVGVTTASGCAWSVSNSLPWVSLISVTSATGSGTVTYRVAANNGADRSGAITIAGLSFTVEQASASTVGFNSGGSMAQVVSGSGWKTSATLVNTGTAPAQIRLEFFDNNGAAMQLPLTFPQVSSPGPLLASTLDRTINGGATLILETEQTGSSPSQEGWAQLTSNGSVSGFAVFRYIPTGQEAAVPPETRNASSYVLPFDNTGGTGTGVALANVSTTAASIPVVIRDDTGASIGNGTISLPAQGHVSFMLTDRYAVTANQRGTVEFATPSGGQIAVLGLRAAPTGVGSASSVTTIQVFAK